MSTHHHIDYVEVPSRDLAATKSFFTTVFDFAFTDYGDDYTAFEGVGITGGFFTSPNVSQAKAGATLIVFYSADLEATQAAVEAAGGTVTQAIFSFPGGRRFHFDEPGGSEFAVWSE